MSDKATKEQQVQWLRDRLQTAFSLKNLPGYMWDGVERWVVNGIPAGDFLMAVFEDKLVEAFARADEANTSCMKDWAGFMYWDVPSSCRGENVATWKGLNAILKDEEDAA